MEHPEVKLEKGVRDMCLKGFSGVRASVLLMSISAYKMRRFTSEI
jgi:hypothetical protein